MSRQILLDLLLSDLRFLKLPSDYGFFVPENLLDRHKEVLRGPYIVQILDFKAIDSSIMHQLETLQNEAHLWLSKNKHRMLKLTLSDGRQTFIGMEQIRLEELDENIALGAKVTT